MNISKEEKDTMYYPFTVFNTRSFSERFPLLTDHGTSALIKAGDGPWLMKNRTLSVKKR